MTRCHVHELYLVGLIDVVELSVGVDSGRKRLVQAKSQIFTAVNAHKNNVFVPGVG